MAPLLIREYDTLKDANKEAYRLARCGFRYTTFSEEFIVGNNTGITLNLSSFNECVRYSMFKYKEIACIGVFSKQNSFLIKVGG